MGLKTHSAPYPFCQMVGMVVVGVYGQRLFCSALRLVDVF